MFARSAALVAATALISTSCANQDIATDEPAGEEPVRGGTLVVAIDSDPGHLNPAITTSGATHTAAELMYNGLVELTPDGEPVPELAESWDVEEDGTLYRFRLRAGVTWHDGEPFTSDDVKFSFEEVLLKYHSRTAASLGNALKSIDAPDERTVEFRFDQPYSPLLLQLDVTEAPIVAKHVYDDGSDPQEHPANLEPVGTGPFSLEEYSAGSEIRMSANENYFKEDLPYLDEVVMRIIPDRGNQVVALEAGEVQWLFGVPGPDLARLRESDRFGFIETPVNPGGSNCIMSVSFNLERPLFDDVDVRRAIAHALDRDQFLERVQFGEGSVATAAISSGIPFAHADDLGLPEFDRAKAERLLDDAGWVRAGDGTRAAEGVTGVDDGTPLSFTFVHFPTFSNYGELFRAQLAEVGAEVKLRSLEPPVFAETVFTKRDFDTNIISYCNGADPEIGVTRMYLSSNVGPVPFSNSSAYRNSEVDKHFHDAKITLDPEQRAEAYRRAQELLVRDMPYVWLVETVATRVHEDRCSGFSHSGHFAESAFCR